MRRFDHRAAVLALVLGLSGAAAGPAPAGLDTVDVTALLQARELATLDGRPARLGDFAGEVLVVNFWASWCAPCRRELPELDRWDRAWQGQGARVVAIALDSQVRPAQRLVQDEALGLTVLYDGPAGLAAQLDLDAVPTTYLLDRQGRVVDVIHGFDTDALDRLHRQAEALRKAPAEATS